MITLALTDDRINAQGGLNLIGKLLSRFCGFAERFPINAAHRSDRLCDADVLASSVGLLVQGRPHYEDIEFFRQPEQQARGLGESFARSLGIKCVPSESVLRERLKTLATTATGAQLAAANLALIKAHEASALEVDGRFYIPLDIDVTPFDNTGSHRENIGRTYKGCDGFAPIMSYVGTQGWLLHHELRPGVQHCQKETPNFLRETLARFDALGCKTRALVRMDAGNDSADTLAILRESEHGFILKRNQRQEDPVKWLSHAMAQSSEPECPRAGKEVYIGTCDHMSPGGESSEQAPLPIIYKVIRRSIDKHGNALLIHEIEVQTYWTNLGETPEAIIALYHDHGTSEQFHSELKSDLNLERFPSQNYATNRLYLALGALAYNLLRALEERARRHRNKWPERIKDVMRRRVGSVIRDLIAVASKWVKHGGREVMKLARDWPWSGVMLAIDAELSV
jgi:Transposase DDE domain group 1